MKDVTIIHKKDIRRCARHKPIEEIQWHDVISHELVEQSKVLLYIDSKGNNKILKNRYGWR